MFNERELLDSKIEKNSPLKEYIVEYVGEKLQPDHEEVHSRYGYKCLG